MGDGVTDDTVALQAALDSNHLCGMPRGRYRITADLIVDPIRNRNCGLVGTAGWSFYSTTAQTGGPAWDGTQEAVIVYDGAVSATACVIRASAEAVGIEPASTFDNNVYGLTLRNVLLDANSKAGYGFYGVRLQEPDIESCCARGATLHGWYINGNYSGRFSRIAAIRNPGCGISVGRAGVDFGWTINNLINATHFDDLYASTNGSDKTYDETTNPIWGYGIGLWLHRANVITSYTSELNDGPALVFSPTGPGNVINMGYSELSSAFSVGGTTAIADGRTARGYGLWFVGHTGGASLSEVIGNVFMAAEGVRLTGTQPSSGRPENGLELRNISGANYLNADWGNYRLINCNSELVAGITGSSPVGAQQLFGGVTFAAGGEILNTYEEGTFSPTVEGTSTAGTGWTYTLNAGGYTRIGRQVFWTAKVTLSAIGAGAAGNVVVKGLPFTVKNGNNYHSPLSITNVQALTTPVVSLSGLASINTTQVLLYKRTAAATGETQLAIGDLSATTSFVLAGQYMV